MNEVHAIANGVILDTIANQIPPTTNWTGSPFERLLEVEIDTRGSVGELLVVRLLRAANRAVIYNPDTTDESKHWDFMCDDLTYEVKTASVGKSGRGFQHENIYKTRQYHGLIFVDIAPQDIYISLWVKAEIKWKDLHFRKDGSYYKWDTSLTSPKILARGKPPNTFCVRACRVTTVEEFAARFAAFEQKIRGHIRPAGEL